MDQHASISIAAVERETGITKETLRIWERRYAFPLPVRTASGKRAYSTEDVTRLKLIGLLIKQGHRPSKLMGLSLASLKQLLEAAPHPKLITTGFEQVLGWLKRGDTAALKNWLISQIAKEGLRPFLENTLGPLLVEIGMAWKQNRLRIHEEHLFSETVQQTLRLIISHLPVITPHPYVLLTTPEGELHGLGLLIVESILALEGIKVTSLGVNTPTAEIAVAASHMKADAVIVSMTTNFKSAEERAVILRELRAALNEHIVLLAGGSGTHEMVSMDNIKILKNLGELMVSIHALH